MKNKILSILCIFILISCLFVNNNVFAYTESSDKVTLYISDEAYELLQTFEEYKSCDYYYWVMYDGQAYYYHFFLKEYAKDIIFYNNYGQPFRSSGAISSMNVYWFKPSDNTKSSLMVWSNKQFETNFSTTSEGYFHYLTNFTVYTDINKSEIFFQPPPATVTGTLAPILEEVEMQEPIITTMVGLAKLLIPLLICLLGFWKAWGVFSRVLHNA